MPFSSRYASWMMYQKLSVELNLDAKNADISQTHHEFRRNDSKFQCGVFDNRDMDQVAFSVLLVYQLLILIQKTRHTNLPFATLPTSNRRFASFHNLFTVKRPHLGWQLYRTLPFADSFLESEVVECDCLGLSNMEWLVGQIGSTLSYSIGAFSLHFF